MRVVVSLQVEKGTELEVRLSGAGNVRHSHRGFRQSTGFGAWVAFRTEAHAIEERRAGSADSAESNEVSDGSEAKAPQSN